MLKELEHIPTQDLIDALSDRCAPMIFIGTRYEGETGDRSWKSFSRWQGNLETCRGMCKEMDAYLERQMVKEECERAISEKD